MISLVPQVFIMNYFFSSDWLWYLINLQELTYHKVNQPYYCLQKRLIEHEITQKRLIYHKTNQPTNQTPKLKYPFYSLAEIIPLFFFSYSFLRHVLIGTMVRSVCQWSGRLGFNPRLNHMKDSKMVLDVSLLNTQYSKVWIKGEWSNPEKGVAPSPTPWCSSYWKGSFWVAINYSWPIY